jgi:ankyrin repeat protein
MAQWGRISLFDAAADGDVEMMKKRLQASWTNINAQDDTNGNTALHEASRWGHLDAVQLLIEREADLTLLNNYEQTAVHLAAEYGHIAVVEVLLGKTPEHLNQQDSSGFTPLHAAAGRGHAETAKRLLELGADRDIKNYDNRTALFCSSNNETTDVIKEFKFESPTQY